MTGKMYKNFLALFEDDHVSVRMALCVACGELALADRLVMANLLHLIKYDASGPVRLEAALAVRLICQHRLSALVGRKLGPFAVPDPDSDDDQSGSDAAAGPNLSLLSSCSQRSTPASPLHPRARKRRPRPAASGSSGSGPANRSGLSSGSGVSGSGAGAGASGPSSASSGGAGGPLMLTGRSRESTAALATIVAQVRSTAIWCFRYESIPALRAEACATLVALHLCKDEEVYMYLQTTNLPLNLYAVFTLHVQYNNRRPVTKKNWGGQEGLSPQIFRKS